LSRAFALVLGAGVTLFLTSCSGDGTRKTYPVTGTLTIDGKPADAGVLVYLHPQFTETDKYPIHPKGETDAAGAFQITTYNTNDGAPEGAYLMTVEFPQRSGLSPHFSGDLFGGAFSNKDANKAKPEFNVTVSKAAVTANLELKLTPDQRKAFEAAKKKSAEKQSGMFNLGGQ
jgi:hypothetical protein